MNKKRKLSLYDRKQIQELKAIKKDLLLKVSYLTDRALAKKFDVSPQTIRRA